MVMTTSMTMDYPGLYCSPWKMKYCRGQKISFNLLNSSRSKKIKENQCLRQNFQLEEGQEKLRKKILKNQFFEPLCKTNFKISTDYDSTSEDGPPCIFLPNLVKK